MGPSHLWTALRRPALHRAARFCTVKRARLVLWLGLAFYAAHLLLPHAAYAAVSFDIVYVRWPRAGDNTLVMLPQGEDPFRASPGADLVLLHPDGTQRILVDCDRCCVQDPMVSFDGEWVYYTKLLDATSSRSPSLLFKMHIAGAAADYREVQLTFDDGFESRWQHGYSGSADDLGSAFSIRDMGPAPLPGGKIAFTSNRPATIAFHQGTHFSITEAHTSSTMQLFVLDDHDGSLTSAALSNLHQIGFGSLHMAMHPIVLKDGRLLFSNWDDAGGKYVYAMTTLYAIHPDGSNLAAITEPHDHHKNVDHFATQLPSGAIVTGQYYPSFDFGFGHLCRFPLEVAGPAYTRDPSRARNTYNGGPISWRSFDRKGWESLTPHTAPDDCPAPNLSGKYAMPCAAPQGALLVAYSPGGVNHFTGCNGGTNHYLDSGIYLIPDAESSRVTDPRDAAQLELILNSPDHNEIWPRAVVSYAEVYGIPEPRALPETDAAQPADDRLEPGAPHAVVGTSSLYNRESAPLHGDPFRQGSNAREIATGAWLIQGTDAGVVRNADIHAVRIVGVVPKPYREPIDKYGATSAEHARWAPYIPDARSDRFVEGYAASHAERWEILAEIPVRKTDAEGNPLLDARGDPDTSFAAKIPANTPFFFQGIDANGMTLFSELTWRSAVPGEVRTDCGGCHAHSIAPVPFEDTAAHRRLPIQVQGIDPADPMITSGLWDVTQRTPLISSAADGTPSVRVVERGMVDIEYFRDIQPILQTRCVSCHKTAGNTTGTDLAFDGATVNDNAYFRLVKDAAPRFGGPAPGGSYMYPQLSRYVRANQARQSLLVWKLFGRRLDGRGNGERQDDLDFAVHTEPHGATIEECRTIARWIDLGCPMDFQGPLHDGYRSTDDNLLPVLSVSAPARGANSSFDGVLRIGAADAETGIDWSSLEVRLDTDLADGVDPQPISLASLARPASSSVAAVALVQQLPADRSILLVVSIRDRAGNQRVDSRRFWLSSNGSPPPMPVPVPPAPPPAPPPAAPEDPPPVDETPSAPPGGGSGSAEDGGGGGGGGCLSSRRGGPGELLVLLVPAAAAWLRRRRSGMAV